jgi:sugar-specific transcriptional regulator TrmB
LLYLLLALGKYKAGEFSIKLNMHRLDMYHDLKSLQANDTVKVTTSKPKKFKAVALDEALEALQFKDQDLIRMRAQALSDLHKVSEKLEL